jgi:glycosyltransferase involved in cell wall biosynthesis
LLSETPIILKKRIAIWIHGGVGGGFFSQGQPPIQNLIATLSRHYEIEVFSLIPANPDFVLQGIRIHTVNTSIRSNAIRWMMLLRKFLAYHYQNPYHLLYAFWGYPAGFFATLLGKVLGKPSVVHLQGGDAVAIASIRYGVFSSLFRSKLCRWTYHRCSLLIALTKYQSTCLKENGITAPVEVIPFGVNTTLFSYKREKRSHSMIKFLHVGNLTPVKDQHTLLTVFSIVTKSFPSELKIIGGDFYDDQLNVWCREFGIEQNVHFLGPVRHEDLPQYYHEADILLHTSLYEGQGLIFSEAAACGTLIAGTRVGLLSDMGDRCGLIASVGDARLLAEKIIKILQSPSDAEAVRITARHWIEDHREIDSANRIVDKLNTLLRK